MKDKNVMLLKAKIKKAKWAMQLIKNTTGKRTWREQLEAQAIASSMGVKGGEEEQVQKVLIWLESQMNFLRM